MNTAVAGLVLAAGRSRRMGRDKRLLPVGGVPMVHLALRAAREGGLDPVLLVRGPEDLSLADGRDVLQVVNPQPERGLASSLALGVAALPENAPAVMVLLADMPGITGAHVACLAAAFAPHEGAEMVAPVCGGRRGNPVVLGRRFFAEILDLNGDVGARSLLTRYGGVLREVEMDAAVLLDVDTPEDWSTLT